MYYVNKIVGWCLSPLGILFLGLGLSWALRLLSRRFRCTDQKFDVGEGGRFKLRPYEMTKGERRCLAASRWILVLTLTFTWILGCGITSRLIGVPLEGEEVEVEKGGGGGEQVDAIVVLGGGVGIHEQCGRVELFSGADRIWTGVRLWKQAGEGVPLILGGGMNEKIAPLLEDFGVPREAWTSCEEARNTEEEAKLIKEHLTHHCPPPPLSSTSKPKVSLVTSAWHLPRAKVLFERAGFEVLGAPTDYEMRFAAEQPVQVRDFFPSAEAMTRNAWALKEWVARFGYWVKRR